MNIAADGNVEAILSDFGGDPQRAGVLAEFLGFEPISNPEDRLAGALSGGLKQFLRGRGDGGYRRKRALPGRKSQGRPGGGWPVGRCAFRLGVQVVRPGQVTAAHYPCSC